MPSGDEAIDISERVIAKLAEFRNEPKYLDMPDYTGTPFEGARLRAEAQLNDLLQRLKDGLPSNPTKGFALEEFKRTMKQFEAPDTEDREQFLSYLEQIMDILAIESSDGLLNRWMYGSVLSRLISERRGKQQRVDPPYGEAGTCAPRACISLQQSSDQACAAASAAR
jgi:hypothetical protein